MRVFVEYATFEDATATAARHEGTALPAIAVVRLRNGQVVYGAGTVGDVVRSLRSNGTTEADDTPSGRFMDALRGAA